MIQPTFQPDPAVLLRQWFRDPATSIRPTSTGTNNKTFQVVTGDQHFMLRLTTDPTAGPRLAREMSLLAALLHLHLPFQTPAPVESLEGEWIVHAGPAGSPILATLFRAIEGRPVDRDDLSLTNQAGSALAILNQAAASKEIEAVDPLITPDQLRAFRIDPDSGCSRSELAETSSVMTVIADQWAEDHSRFPDQMIHADFYPSNVLAHEGKLTGIIDFELSLSGPRALDLAIGLWTFAGEAGTFNWAAVESFASGYFANLPVSEAEIAAIPRLILLREAGSLVHWTKRFERGLIEEGAYRWRIERLHDVHSTMEQTGEELVRRVRSALHATEKTGTTDQQ